MTAPTSRELADALAQFPRALRDLVDAELAAGNRVLEIGHSFPAPPAGAYVRLEHKVSTRPRAPDETLDWRGRNSSLSSGEFTDARRFYFVVEPPDPPPPEIDMDALRQSSAGSSEAAREPMHALRLPRRPKARRRQRARVSVARGPLTVRELPDGVSFALAVRDARPPSAVWAVLEETTCLPFSPTIASTRSGTEGTPPDVDTHRAMGDGDLVFSATANMSGAGYTLALRYDTAAARTNHYTFLVTGSWARFQSEHHAYFRRQADGWLDLWSRPWTSGRWTPPAPSAEGLRRRRTRAVLIEARRLANVETLQAEIVAGLLRGGRYTWSDKEGTTRIAWNGHAFTRRGEGDHVANDEVLADEAALLRTLRGLCGMTMRTHGAAPDLPEVDAWRVALRMMQPPA